MLSHRVFIAWLAEFICAISIIVCNKLLMRNLNFTFPITLTALHFICTGVVTHALSSRDVLCRTFRLMSTNNATIRTEASYRRQVTANETHIETALPSQKTVPVVIGNDADETGLCSSPPFFAYVLFAGISSAAIVMSNASLCVNSVAFYQIMKLPTLLFVAALEMCSRVQTYDRVDFVCFMIIILGVGVTIEGELSTSATGFMIALASTFFTVDNNGKVHPVARVHRARQIATYVPTRMK